MRRAFPLVCFAGGLAARALGLAQTARADLPNYFCTPVFCSWFTGPGTCCKGQGNRGLCMTGTGTCHEVSQTCSGNTYIQRTNPCDTWTQTTCTATRTGCDMTIPP